MRSNALRKEEQFAPSNDNAVTRESWEITRARIAQATEKACNLAGNETAVDMEEFIFQYGAKSDFV